MNQSARPPFKGSPLEVAQQETAQHVGDIVAREPREVPLDTIGPPEDAQMAEWSIHFNGRQYVYCGYRYTRLADAVGYARLMSGRLWPEQCGDASAASETIEPPSVADQQLMAAHSISFRAGVYEFSGYHYDRLEDALNYARSKEKAPGGNPGNEHA